MACADSASIERSSGILVSSASPVQETNAVGMHSVTLFSPRMRKAGLVGVPRGVAAGLEGGAEAAGREARRVGLALHQVGAGEVEHHPALPVRRDQRVVLLGGESGKRLEPVGEVGGAVLDGPVLHRGRHHVGHLGIERLAQLDGPHQALEHLLRQPLAHDRREKTSAPKMLSMRVGVVAEVPFEAGVTRWILNRGWAGPGRAGRYGLDRNSASIAENVYRQRWKAAVTWAATREMCTFCTNSCA